MIHRRAGRRLAIHLTILLALATPVAGWGGQTSAGVPGLKSDGGEVESYLTPRSSNDTNSMLERSDKLGMISPSPAPQNNGGLKIPGVGNEQVPWSIVIMLTALTLIPSILLCMTPFARLLIVFHFLRQALGLQTTPSNQTLIGLSLILTFFLMQPTATSIYQAAIIPMQTGQITAMEAVTRSEDPIRKFMAHYVREKDVALFIELAHDPPPASINDVSMRVMLPAYILSELKAGFQIGTVLFLPFLIVDMVVASITTSVGMLQLPPVVISTPLKLLLFLMVDGWHLLIGSLMRSFY
jgi:flagellar biosynthetic protein FliP